MGVGMSFKGMVRGCVGAWVRVSGYGWVWVGMGGWVGCDPGYAWGWTPSVTSYGLQTLQLSEKEQLTAGRSVSMVTVYVSGDTGSAPVLTGLAVARVARASVAAVISRCTILD